MKATDKQEDSAKSPGVVLWIFHFIGILGLFVFTAGGLFYMFNGNLIVAGLGALLSAAVSWLLAYQAFQQKVKPIVGNAATRAKLKQASKIIIAFYAILALSLYVLNFHAIELESSQKDAIKTQALDKLTQLKNMQKSYKSSIRSKVSSFKTSLATSLNNMMVANDADKEGYANQIDSLLGKGMIDFKDYLRNPEDEKAQQELKKAIETAKLMEEKKLSNKYTLKGQDNYLKEYYVTFENVFENWNRQSLSFYYNDIDVRYDAYLKAAKSKMPDFEYQDLKSQDINISSPLYSIKNAGLGSFMINTVVIILTHALVLIIYILAKAPESSGPVTKRNSKHIIDDYKS